jgi:hypothetical protein
MQFAGGENDRYHLHSKYGINDAGKLILIPFEFSLCVATNLICTTLSCRIDTAQHFGQ